MERNFNHTDKQFVERLLGAQIRIQMDHRCSTH
jgi:hypothetical protein